MKAIQINDEAAVERALAGMAGEDIVVLRDGHAVAMVTPFDDDDLEWYATESDPEFIASITRARAQVARGETMSFDDLEAIASDQIDALDLRGFSRPVSVETLQRTNCAGVPREPGIYVVVRPPSQAPSFLERSVAGAHKSKDPSYPLEVIRSKWSESATVLYIGMSDEGLQRRLRDYMSSGLGGKNRHSGGRLIWHLHDHRQLFVRWKIVAGEPPQEVELQMIGSFFTAHGKLPFANFKGKPKSKAG